MYEYILTVILFCLLCFIGSVIFNLIIQIFTPENEKIKNISYDNNNIVTKNDYLKKQHYENLQIKNNSIINPKNIYKNNENIKLKHKKVTFEKK